MPGLPIFKESEIFRSKEYEDYAGDLLETMAITRPPFMISLQALAPELERVVSGLTTNITHQYNSIQSQQMQQTCILEKIQRSIAESEQKNQLEAAKLGQRMKELSQEGSRHGKMSELIFSFLNTWPKHIKGKEAMNKVTTVLFGYLKFR